MSADYSPKPDLIGAIESAAKRLSSAAFDGDRPERQRRKGAVKRRLQRIVRRPLHNNFVITSGFPPDNVEKLSTNTNRLHLP